MHIARTVLAAAALVGVAGSAHAATSIVRNGSFEAGSEIVGLQQVDAGETDIDDWTVGGDSVDLISYVWQPSEGERSIDLSGAAAGTLSQLLATISGQLYSVTFDISKNPDDGFVPRLGSSTVSYMNGASEVVLATKALSYSADNDRNIMNWRKVSYTFLAMSPQTLLSFAGDGPSSRSPSSDPGRAAFGEAFGLALDNVSVVAIDSVPAVPEPATWALMILGFGIVGAALRRRRAQVRFNFA